MDGTKDLRDARREPLAPCGFAGMPASTPEKAHLVVAEGAENAYQLDFVVALGCKFARGYYFTEPLVPCDLAAHLQFASPAVVARGARQRRRHDGLGKMHTLPAARALQPPNLPLDRAPRPAEHRPDRPGSIPSSIGVES